MRLPSLSSLLTFALLSATPAASQRRVLKAALADTTTEKDHWLVGLNPTVLLKEREHFADSDFKRYERHYEYATLALQLAKYGSIQNYTNSLEEDAELEEMDQQRKDSPQNV